MRGRGFFPTSGLCISSMSSSVFLKDTIGLTNTWIIRQKPRICGIGDIFGDAGRIDDQRPSVHISSLISPRNFTDSLFRNHTIRNASNDALLFHFSIPIKRCKYRFSMMLRTVSSSMLFKSFWICSVPNAIWMSFAY